MRVRLHVPQCTHSEGTRTYITITMLNYANRCFVTCTVITKKCQNNKRQGNKKNKPTSINFNIADYANDKSCIQCSIAKFIQGSMEVPGKLQQYPATDDKNNQPTNKANPLAKEVNANIPEGHHDALK